MVKTTNNQEQQTLESIEPLTRSSGREVRFKATAKTAKKSDKVRILFWAITSVSIYV